MTDEEAKLQFTKIAMNCTKKYPLEVHEILDLQKLKVPTKKTAKCLLACAYRLEGSMNEKGLLDYEHMMKTADLLADGDEKRLKNAKAVADICIKVNDETVNDGEAGCDRAALLFKCATETAPKYGFKV